MALNILFDTGLLIRYFRGDRQAIRHLRAFSQRDRMVISVVTRLEVLAGANPKDRFVTKRVLSRFVAQPLSLAIGDRAGEIIYHLRQSRITIETSDAIIAASALALDIPLVTLNRKHFEAVPGLRLFPIALDQ